MANFDASLLQAASEGDVSKLRILIEKNGVSVNTQGQMNRTPLHLAALYGKMEAVTYLVEKGANKNLKGNSGETPLHLATLNGHVSIVEYLLEEGADWRIANDLGKTAKDYARKPNLKKLFEDAENGQVKTDDSKATQIDNNLVNQLVSAGYKRAEILDAIYTVAEQGGNPSSVSEIVKVLAKINANSNENINKNSMEISEENICKVCFENQIDTVIVPCGHICICSKCSKDIGTCPICRNLISQIIKTFKS